MCHVLLCSEACLSVHIVGVHHTNPPLVDRATEHLRPARSAAHSAYLSATQTTCSRFTIAAAVSRGQCREELGDVDGAGAVGVEEARKGEDLVARDSEAACREACRELVGVEVTTAVGIDLDERAPQRLLLALRCVSSFRSPPSNLADQSWTAREAQRVRGRRRSLARGM
jgi:hypothetical protein